MDRIRGHDENEVERLRPASSSIRKETLLRITFEWNTAADIVEICGRDTLLTRARKLRDGAVAGEQDEDLQSRPSGGPSP